MASININNSNKSEEMDIPKWKRELINEKKTFGRTISTSSGLAKLTVTCPRKMRPAIKKQISLPNQNLNKNNVSIEKVWKNDFITTLDMKPVQNGDCCLINEKLVNNSQEEGNFPKPGIVQSLKTKYMSFLKKDDKCDKLTRHSRSLEILIKDGDNYLQEEQLLQLPAVCNTRNNNLELENKDYLPPTDTVKQTKKLFETATTNKSAAELIQRKKQTRSLSTTNLNQLQFQKESKLNENPFIQNSNYKPPIKPKLQALKNLTRNHHKVSTAHKSSQTSENDQCSTK